MAYRNRSFHSLSRRFQRPGYVFGDDRLTESAMGSPTQIIWTTRMTTSKANGRAGIAERGTTTRFIMRYTAAPYATPERTGLLMRTLSCRLAP